MAISLEELKRQRARIQQHLDWLDAQIATEEDSVACPLVGRPEQKVNQTDPEDAPEPKPATGTPAPKDAEPEAIEASGYQPKTQEELLRTKIGCFLFFALGVVLFLFLLFGLPYLL